MSGVTSCTFIYLPTFSRTPTHAIHSSYSEGQGRITLFASSGNARTYNYQPGDVSYIPASYGHYVENIGNTTMRFLEIFNSGTCTIAPDPATVADAAVDRYQDISLSQWLALTPPELVKAHLNLSDTVIDHLNKTKAVVIGSSSSS